MMANNELIIKVSNQVLAVNALQSSRKLGFIPIQSYYYYYYYFIIYYYARGQHRILQTRIQTLKTETTQTAK